MRRDARPFVSFRENVTEISAAVQPFLRAYMVSRGVEIDAKGRFQCPAHDDKRPSANLIPGTHETRWYCHACHEGGTIQDMHHFLEGAPLGPGQLYENLLPLAKEFLAIEPGDLRELTEDESHEFRVYQAHDHAARLLTQMETREVVNDKLAVYGWPAPMRHRFGIGGVRSHADYLAAMAKLGYDRKFLHSVDLDNPRIFSEKNLIFAIKDENGRPVGFSARNLEYEAQRDAAERLRERYGKESVEYESARRALPAKYINSMEASYGVPRNTIYQKGRRLFGFFAAKASRSQTLYVFEGQADVVTAVSAGLLNCCSVCGTALSRCHFELILARGFKHIVLALDGDTAGEKGVEKCLRRMDEYGLAEKRPDVRVDIISIPDGADDPDRMIRLHGLDTFLALPKYSVFDWQVKRELRKNKDGLVVALGALDKVLRQPQPLLRYEMLTQLSAATALPIEHLFNQLVARARDRADPISTEVVQSARMIFAMRADREAAKRVLTAMTKPEPWESVDQMDELRIGYSMMVPIS